MNLAAIWKLPVLFVCENNLYGEYSPIASTTPVTELVRRAESYAMPGVRVDGNDVLAVRAAAAEARARALSGAGPTMIEALTYRYMGHSRSDPGAYRPPGELDRWRGNDPIDNFEGALGGRPDIDGDDLSRVRERGRAAVAEALERALSWPEPAPESRFDYVWAVES